MEKEQWKRIPTHPLFPHLSFNVVFFLVCLQYWSIGWVCLSPPPGLCTFPFVIPVLFSMGALALIVERIMFGLEIQIFTTFLKVNGTSRFPCSPPCRGFVFHSKYVYPFGGLRHLRTTSVGHQNWCVLGGKLDAYLQPGPLKSKASTLPNLLSKPFVDSE